MTVPSEPVLGAREEDFDNCALPLVRRVYALLGQDDTKVRTGDPMPRGWQFILFTPMVPQHQLGPDGAPTGSGLVIGPEGMPRRMMGGRRITFFSDIPIGADLRRVSEVVSTTEKSGRSGRFAVVTTRQLIHVGDSMSPALQEDTDTIFREPAAASGTAAEAAPAPARQAGLRESVTIDPTMLFRYSACTFNAHRIHYDHPYATGTEGYPGLVVNGGLTVLLLREYARKVGDFVPMAMTSRNIRPVYCGTTIQLCALKTAEGIALWAEDAQGYVCAEVTLAA